MKKRIKLVGVGDCGCKVVRAAVEKLPFVPEILCVNTKTHPDSVSGVTIGSETTGGLGCGGDPETGELAAEESKELLIKELRGYDEVIVVAGFGRGTGTGAAPVICELAQKNGAKVSAVVATPFSFEGTAAMRRARKGLQALEALKIEVREIHGSYMEQRDSTMQQVLANVADAMAAAISDIFAEREQDTHRLRIGVLLREKLRVAGQKRCRICMAVLAIAGIVATALCVLPVMRTTVTGGETGELVIRGFNLMSFSAWGVVPLLAPLLIPIFRKNAPALALLLTGNLVCYVHSLNAARAWLMSLEHTMITYEFGMLVFPAAFVAVLIVTGFTFYLQRKDNES